MGNQEQMLTQQDEQASVLFIDNSFSSIENESISKAEGRTTKDGRIIPNAVTDSERIVRTVYEPIHLKKNTKELKFKAFESPRGLDEMSVTRLDYSSADFCKQFGKGNQNPEKLRSYYGLAVLQVSQIRAIEIEEYAGDVVYSPIDENEAHADIKLGWSAEKGQQYSAEQQYMMDTLVEKAKLYPDIHKDKDIWEGPELLPKQEEA